VWKTRLINPNEEAGFKQPLRNRTPDATADLWDLDHLAKRGRLDRSADRGILFADTTKIRLDLTVADFQRVNYVVLMSTRFIPEF
jgi:hypothetical protein